ncbi:MAG: hypothetical protein RBT65_14710 [Methanolobus sp.]|nr:hypothetical protein [Methanolobus sp.]
MAAQDKKISALTEWIYGSIADTANIVVAHAGENYKIAMSTIRQYVLGDRVIGGAGSRDIVTNGDEQILAYKMLYEPSFNDEVTLSWDVTATQMNFLSGLGQNVQNALNSLGGDILTIENRIDDLELAVNALQADKIYSVGIGAAATSITIHASSISEYKINPDSLSISVYEQTGSLSRKLINLSSINISISDNLLSSITIGDVEPGTAYQIVIRYRLVEE